MAEYFVKITDEFEPLNMTSLPNKYEKPFSPINPHEVAERIRNARKPKSAVEGDPIPQVLNRTADLLAIPATRAMNLTLSEFTWPQQWKMETQSAIPKTPNPNDYSELRNISCTNFLSKILESFVLDKLKQEVVFKYNQFGGIKGTGAPHFLVELQQHILQCLEDGQSAVSLLAVDFSKAFNRMSHRVCLDELALRGASTESIRMVATFLDKRLMRLKV